MDIAIIGCGFSSYLYGGTLCNHPSLNVVGVYDRDAERARLWCQKFGSRAFASLDEVLTSGAALAVNLTNPGSHYEVTLACLEAGKHVYTEKPLAASAEETRELIELAQRKGLALGCAPCSLLGESAQTLWRAVRSGIVGRIHTAYVSLCVPPTTSSAANAWVRSQRLRGLADAHAQALHLPVTWPYADEFEVGAAYEHAAYPLKWLTSWFGPVKRLVNYSVCRAPHKLGWDYLQRAVLEVATCTSDLYVSCLSLEDDVEVLMINSTIMSDDLRFVLHGENGSLEVGNQWDFGAPVWVARPGVFMPPLRFVYPHATPARFSRRYPRAYQVNMDYARGIADLARTLEEGAPRRYLCSVSQELHIQEVTDLVARTRAGTVVPQSTFEGRPAPRALPRFVSIGVIGASATTQGYLPELAQNRQCRLIRPAEESGEVPCDEKSAGVLAQEVVFRREDALLLHKEADLVINLAAPARRGKLTLAYLRAGKHVLSEPPLAGTLADARVIRKQANDFGLRAACAMPAAMNASSYLMARSLREGHLGTISRIISEAHCATAAMPESSSWSALIEHIEAVAYHLWLATWVVGPAWRVRATPSADSAFSGSANITFTAGATMELRWHVGPEEQQKSVIEFHAAQGVASESTGERPHCTHSDATACEHFGACEEPLIDSPVAARGAIDMCRSICEGSFPRNSIDHAVHQVEILEMCTLAARTGREITARDPAVQGSWMPEETASSAVSA